MFKYKYSQKRIESKNLRIDYYNIFMNAILYSLYTEKKKEDKDEEKGK